VIDWAADGDAAAYSTSANESTRFIGNLQGLGLWD
jgi:hypothetical protein